MNIHTFTADYSLKPYLISGRGLSVCESLLIIGKTSFSKYAEAFVSKQFNNSETVCNHPVGPGNSFLFLHLSFESLIVGAPLPLPTLRSEPQGVAQRSPVNQVIHSKLKLKINISHIFSTDSEFHVSINPLLHISLCFVYRLWHSESNSLSWHVSATVATVKINNSDDDSNITQRNGDSRRM